ncbi:MAG: hypothetical protein RMM08_03995 [Armatimonadota bacterium]|nr:hypothetical protein [bacterium]MDW8320505.1 hypothetical protein [Armatimonadota bacterium]
MSHDDYRVLAARIRAELEDVERVVGKAERAVSLVRQHPGEDIYVDAAAHNLHDFYSALERLFLQIAKVVDRSVPTGERWHRDLLEQMRLPMSTVRPAILDAGMVAQLDEYLRFRHVVRNVYSFQVDPQRVVQLVDGMRALFWGVAEQLRQFAQMLEHWSSEAQRG